MNNNNGGLYFGAGIDMTQWRRDIDKMRRDILGLTQQTQQQTRQIDNAFKKLSVGIAGYFSAQALMGFTRELIRVRGEFQQIEIAFTTMLGSGEKAKALMGDMVTLAAKTPFSLQEVASGAKQLLAYQVPAKEITDTLRRMGDIAAGLGVPLNRILLVYGQVKAKGKLMGDDLRQFTEAGIPLLAELANKYRTNTAEIQAMVSAGKIGFNDVKEVLFNMTDQGGMFFNLMEKQSKSLTGQISNLQDAFDRMLNNIGESQEGLLNSGIQGLNYLVEHYKEVLNVIEGVTLAYGAYRGALVVVAAAEQYRNMVVTKNIETMSFSEKMVIGRALVTERQAVANLKLAQTELTAAQAKLAAAQADKTAEGFMKASIATKEINVATTKVASAQEALAVATKNASALSEQRLTLSQMARLSVTRLLAQAQALLNATMLNNPIVLAIVAITGLVYAYVKLVDHSTAAERAQKRFNEQTEKNKKEMEELTRKTEEYISVIRNANASQYDQYEAYRKLQELYGPYLKNLDLELFKKMEIAKVNELIANAKFDKEIAKYDKQIADSKKKIEELKREAEIEYQASQKIKDENAVFHSKRYLDKLEELDIEEKLLKKNERKKANMLIQNKLSKMNRAELKEYYENYKTAVLHSLKLRGKLTNEIQKANEKSVQSLKLVSGMKDLLASLSVKTLLDELDKVNRTLSGIENAKNAEANLPKNKAYWENQKNAAEEAINAMAGGKTNAAAKPFLAQIAEANRELEKYNYSVHKTVKTRVKTGIKNAIKGSLGDLEKQLSDVQEQLNNKTLTTNKKEIARLLKQEEDLQKQIAEVKKAYGKKSFDEQMQETKRQIEVRDKLLANGYSAEVTDQMFPKIKDKSYIGYLEDTAKALREVVESGKGDEETANNLARITDEINRLNGVKEVMDKFRKSVTDDLSDIKTDAEKLDYLKQKMQALTQAEIDAGAKAYLQGEIEKVQENFKQSYKQLLEEHKTYEEKRLEIIQKYAALREEAERQNDGEAKRKVSKAMEEELNKLSMDMIQKSQEWQYAFSELEGITDASLKRILDKLLEFQEKSKGTLSIQDAATLQGAIDKVKSAGEKNPFEKLISAFDHFKEAKEDFTNANKDVEQAQKEYNQAVAEFGADSEQARNAQDKLNQAQERGLIADKKLADAKKKLISDLGDAKEIFNALGAGVRDVADAFGGFDEATNDAVEGIMNVGNAALDFATSIAQGGTAGMIKAGIQLIGAIFKSLSGDKRKERHIKAWAAEVKNLENAYSSLERQLKRTLGEAKYKEQNAMIDNLKSQQRLLNQMADEEARKKHADKDKIADYRNRANAINDQIKDITDNMKNAIVGITTEGLADKLGDVLYDAWSKGVDGAKEYDKAVEDVMRNAVKNALKQKLLAPYIQGLIDELVYKLGFRVDKDGKVTGSFDGLSKWEQEDWKRRVKEKIQPFVSALNYLDDFFKDTGVDGGANSLQGAIKGMSEQTAGVLAGQFNAIRIYVAEILKIMQGGKSNSNTSIIGAEYKESLDKFAKNLETTKLNAFADMTKLKLQMQEVSNKNIESQTQLKSMVFELSKIEANTRNLHQMRRDLSEMNRKMDRNDLRPKGL
ncbi:tape measure protein [Riemerella columbipharyngis]|uniref:Tape measure domain-containing protein n=1 Tax=Riemerella columbipharyngis TaxID=1071918 RepID=A0A1G7AKA8_9FLAO|nr:tape measure protein [Riemerella columbipharyngis]SDE15251.1 tape measure domain-containing protein [Riemerella columbipharyngis]